MPTSKQKTFSSQAPTYKFSIGVRITELGWTSKMAMVSDKGSQVTTANFISLLATLKRQRQNCYSTKRKHWNMKLVATTSSTSQTDLQMSSGNRTRELSALSPPSSSVKTIQQFRTASLCLRSLSRCQSLKMIWATSSRRYRLKISNTSRKSMATQCQFG